MAERIPNPMSDDKATSWQPIDSAPKDKEILVYTKPWGPIVATFSEEFGEWLSRMQVPVSIKDENELPTHWQSLPDPPQGVEGEKDDTAPGAPERRGTDARSA